MAKGLNSDSTGVAFGRSGVFWAFLKAMEKQYPGSIERVQLPQSLIDEPMRLMPLNEMTRYFGILNETFDDPLYIAKGASHFNLSDVPKLHSVVLSAPIFFTAMIRFNYLFKAFQSGTRCYTEHTSQLVKWCYDTSIPVVSERLQDGIIAAWTFIHLVRHYHGPDYSPKSLHLPGSRLGEKGEAEKVFGCEIVWNAKRTEVWCDRSIMNRFAHSIPKGSHSIDEISILDCVDLPDDRDFARCVFETVNYARAFGYPKLEFIAQIMMMSPLTLQRKLQRKNMSFTELVKFQLLYVLAPDMMLKGLSVDDIAAKLGFSNTQSFSKAFKKAHQKTPKQYLDSLDEHKGVFR